MLYIIRGLPGSGKSTLAKMLLNYHRAQVPFIPSSHYETDMFFVNEKGEYLYDHTRIHEAHRWCQSCVFEELDNSDAVVIVSNTFVKWEHIQPYVAYANRLEHSIQLLECKGNFGSIHYVPKEHMARMKKQWEEVEIGVK